MTILIHLLAIVGILIVIGVLVALFGNRCGCGCKGYIHAGNVAVCPRCGDRWEKRPGEFGGVGADGEQVCYWVHVGRGEGR